MILITLGTLAAHTIVLMIIRALRWPAPVYPGTGDCAQSTFSLFLTGLVQLRLARPFVAGFVGRHAAAGQNQG